MTKPEIQRLEEPPEIGESVTGVLIDGSITFSMGLPERAEMAFTIPTPAGESPPFYLLRHNGAPFWYVHFHGVDFMTASANVEVGFTRTWFTIYHLGIREVISGAAAGGMDPKMRPGDLVIADDFFDFSTSRPRSMLTEIWERLPWIGASYVPPMCPDLTGSLREGGKSYQPGQVFESATIAQFEGHRFESPAEIRRARAAGGDVVHHHQASEAIYARELGVCYGALNYVSNIAAGMASDWDESWLSQDETAQINTQCYELMVSTLIWAGGREGRCAVCSVPEDQPVEIRPEHVLMKPRFR
ncbi:MAG: hypothetical protein R3335_05910 [Anaerolineales bacterium]|nr:hypothetical protein [Anaerolineales bacterium]